jgi:YHS domain-containing protein
MASKAICPVMNAPIDKKIARSKRMVRTFKGKEVFLCCPPCVVMFDKDPAKYAA